MKTMSEIFDINELTESNFTVTFKIINQYQQKEPVLVYKLKIGKYKRCYFCGGRNKVLTL